MNKKPTEYEQLVIDIITAKTRSDQAWRNINYYDIEEAAKHIDWAVTIALAKLEVGMRTRFPGFESIQEH